MKKNDENKKQNENFYFNFFFTALPDKKTKPNTGKAAKKYIEKGPQ